MILDTNVLIHLSKYQLAPEKILSGISAISIITKIETLGFRFKNIEEHDILTAICGQLKVIPLNDTIADQTIVIRHNYKIKLADAIIYSTALVEKVPLLTNNIKDFENIAAGVTLINPFDL